MSAIAVSAEPAKTCQILILSEDFPTYEQAVEVCRRIFAQFSDELDFSFNSWNFIELADAHCARSAARMAAGADIVLISMRGSELPSLLGGWLDTFPEQKIKTSGALVLVPNGPVGSPEMIERLATRLEQAAKRMGKDFVPLLPGIVQSESAALPANDLPLEAMRQNNNSERLNYDHWGLNE